jgi:hypothetical protein
MCQEGLSIQDFNSTDQYSDAILQYASIFRLFFNHRDWPQLHAFFSKRYSKSSFLTNRSARKLTAPRDGFYEPGKSVTVHFNTDPSTVGLPKEFTNKLGDVYRKAKAGMTGPDSQNCCIGPAIGVGIGAGAYMDLLYAGNPPGAYPTQSDRSRETVSVKKGGRGRTLYEWHELWVTIAEWVYEFESTSLLHHILTEHSFKYRLSDEEDRKIRSGRKIPRKYLATDPIGGADAIRDVFGLLCDNPVKFHGLEWDFLTLEVSKETEDAFLKRFGPRQQDRAVNLEKLREDTHLHGKNGNQLSYDEVSPAHLKPCPETYKGIDWENWLLSIEGGDVVIVKTVFQVSL